MKKIVYFLGFTITLLIFVFIFFQINLLFKPDAINSISWKYTQYQFQSIYNDEFVYTADVYRANKEDIDVQIEYSDQNEVKSLLNWNEILNSDIIINAGYFDKDYKPTGFLQVNGIDYSSNYYDSQTTGLVLIENGLIKLIPSPSLERINNIRDNKEIDAFQSYPILIKEKENQLNSDSKKQARRTILADNTNEIIIMIIDSTPISLYEIAKIIERENNHLAIDTAINLDGGQSTGIIANLNDHQKTLLPFTPIPYILQFN